MEHVSTEVGVGTEGQSETFPTVGGAWRWWMRILLAFAIGMSLVQTVLFLTHGKHAVDILYVVSPFIIIGVMAAIVLFAFSRDTVAFTKEGLIYRRGVIVNRRTVVPWDQVEDVETWWIGPYQEMSREKGISIKVKPEAVPRRDDHPIKVFGNPEELQRILAAMEKYSGREFKL